MATGHSMRATDINSLSRDGGATRSTGIPFIRGPGDSRATTRSWRQRPTAIGEGKLKPNYTVFYHLTDMLFSQLWVPICLGRIGQIMELPAAKCELHNVLSPSFSVATTHPVPATDGYSVGGHSAPPVITNSVGYSAPSQPPPPPRPPLKSGYTVVHHFVEPPAKKPHKGRL